MSTAEVLEAVILFVNLPERKIYIGSGLNPKHKRKLNKFLRVNVDFFAWSYVDVTGIPPELIKYKLNVNSSCTPVKQKKENRDPSETRS